MWPLGLSSNGGTKEGKKERFCYPSHLVPQDIAPPPNSSLVRSRMRVSGCDCRAHTFALLRKLDPHNVLP